jgi:replicative DNA helicase
MANLLEMANIQAEKELLNAILSKPQTFHKISSVVKVDDFSRESHRCIYAAMADMVLAGESLDVVTVVEKLRRMGKIDAVGGITAISDIGRVGFVPDILSQARIVAEHSRRRKLVIKGRELADAASDYKVDIDQVAYDMSLEIAGINAKAEEETKSLSDGIFEFVDMIDRRANRQDDAVCTGLADVDKRIVSFEPGHLVVIAGRPGHGKSALAGTIAVNMAQRGKNILMFSMEMSRAEIIERFVARLGKLKGGILRRPNNMSELEKQQYFNGMEAVSKLPIYINEKGALTPADVASIASRVKSVNGLDLIIIDYLQLMSGGLRSDSRVQEISYITKTLKGLAADLKVPIILLSQLSRANEKERRAPRQTDLRDSGSIEQDANTILLMHREEDNGQLSNMAVINVSKQRGGEPGLCRVMFMADMCYFVNFGMGGNYEGENFKVPV